VSTNFVLDKKSSVQNVVVTKAAVQATEEDYYEKERIFVTGFCVHCVFLTQNTHCLLIKLRSI
jgi:hypothetical protein